jgi:hypothetical protein
MKLFGKEISTQAQAIFIVVVLAVAAILFYRTLAPGPELESDINFVCVATGRTYTVDREQINTFPVENPDTHEMTLLPCVQRDGRLYLDSHYREVLEDLGEVNRYVDEYTLAVKSAP